jgi:hypothetical protein
MYPFKLYWCTEDLLFQFSLFRSDVHIYELVRRPVATEPVPGLWILNQTVNPLKVLLFGQIVPMDLDGLHLPLQHLRAKKNYISMSM